MQGKWALCNLTKWQAENNLHTHLSQNHLVPTCHDSTVFSQPLMKAGMIHVLRRILHFRWLGQTVLKIHLSHGVYVNFKVHFSH